MEPSTVRRWAPAGVAFVAFAAVVGWSAAGGSSGDPQAGPEATTAVASGSTVPSDGSFGTAPTMPATTVAKVPLGRVLTQGIVGDDVKMVQQRLSELGFDPGGVDGVYGPTTRQSVWAFEKLVLGTPKERVTGEVTPEMWERLQEDGLIVPRRVRSGETHMEVYLPEQVAVVFDDATPRLVTHISTGSGEEWCEEVTIDPGQYGNENGTEPLVKGVCGRSETPGGIYQFNRRFDGWREGQLGRMHNPVYFNYGVAVHGASNVPLQPASHGCVRIPMHISEYFPTLVSRGDVIYVFDGVKEPEAYGAQPPPFNWPDPSYTTTTTTTSTTTTTTVAPTTTKPAATTTTKAPATTPAPEPTSAPTTVTETTASGGDGSGSGG